MSSTPDHFATAWATAVTATPGITFTPTVTPSPTATLWQFSPLTKVPTLLPTSVSVQQVTPSQYMDFSLSFYDPHIGFYFPEIADINCLQFDYQIRDCVSKVHHGQDDYHLWYRRGAACSQLLAYDTVFEVISPPELAGVWRCIDVGALDVGDRHYIDFMLRYPDDIWTGDNLDKFPWSSRVQIKILSIP